MYERIINIDAMDARIRSTNGLENNGPFFILLLLYTYILECIGDFSLKGSSHFELQYSITSIIFIDIIGHT